MDRWFLGHDVNTAYFGVVKARGRRVRLHMCPDEGAEGADRRGRVRKSFGFGRQATSSTLQTRCPHHYRAGIETGDVHDYITDDFSWCMRIMLNDLRQPVCSTDWLLPSLTIPTTRHFWKRQYWHRFLLRLSTGQFLAAKQTYLAFFCTVRWR